ncbi:MAG: hypothetical protein A2Y23_11750 [Clostridiales bacterium GWB2_37_7]|nr:MAG: hypothetical protein A2Y23_11750 [Clostridiales bacterium GWB2_37_7]
MQKLEHRIAEAEKDMQAVLQQYHAEALDVEHMKKDSLSIIDIIEKLKESRSELFRELESLENSKKDLLIKNNNAAFGIPNAANIYEMRGRNKKY